MPISSKLLKVIGFFIVVVSIFVTWITYTVFGTVFNLSLLDMLRPAGNPPSMTAVLLQQLSEVALILIVVGLMVAVLARDRIASMGGLLVILAPVSFALGVALYADAGFRAVAEYGLGFYLAILGGAILSLQLITAKLA